MFSSKVARNLFKTHVHGLQVPRIDIATVKSSLSKPAFHLIDVRETNEWNKEFISTAIYLGRGNLERDIESVVPNVNDEIVLYCAGGVRSILAAKSLIDMGYANVKSMDGGITEWKEAGYSIQKEMQVFSEVIDF